MWKYGISGDLPILLLNMKDKDEVENLTEVLKAYNYFRVKNIMVDLVIVNQEKYSYEDNLKNEIYNCISNENLSYLQNIKGGIFVLENLTSEDIKFLQYRANLSLDSSNGNIYRYLKEQEEEYLEKIKNLPFEETPRTIENIQAKREKLEDLKYLNEYGGFSQDGKEN